MFIDTHCHLDFEPFRSNMNRLMADTQALGVDTMLVPGVLRMDWERIKHLVDDQSDRLVAAYGLHPCFCTQHNQQDVEDLYAFCRQAAPKAVGEIGLDFFIEDHDSAFQLSLFKSQIEVAAQLHLPIVVHCRKAHDQCLKAIKEMGFTEGGIIHAYSGSLEQGQRYLDLGFKLGIGGGATYERAKKLHRIISTLPLTSFVLETDAPDIPPSFAREEPNTPANLPRIAAIIANHVDIPLETLAEITTANAKEVLRL